MKRILSNVLAVIWFFWVLLGTILFMPICLIMIPFDIVSIIKSGFITTTIGFIILTYFSFVYGITMLVPPFRLCFKKLPWLYPYINILMIDILILSIAAEILNIGFSVQSSTRHIIFIIIMIIQIIICRIGMCLYCNKKSMKIESDN